MTAVMQGIAENGGNTAIVLATVGEVAGDVLNEGRLRRAQEVAHIIEPEHDRGEMLG